MKLVKNVKQLHKAGSVQAAVLAAVVGLQEVLPVWEGIVPDDVFTYAGAGLATLAVVLRAIDQNLGSTD